jgi:hypothetical protein
MLAYGFTENRQFGAKTDQNSIFLGRDPHILKQLYIMVLHMSFYGFWNFSIFCSKSIGVSLQFYRKSLVWVKNWTNSIFRDHDNHIMDQLYITVPYMNFYVFWQNPNLRSQSIGVPTVLEKITSLGHKLTETQYFLVVNPILQIGCT